jgi:hypothetical protein
MANLATADILSPATPAPARRHHADSSENYSLTRP